MISFGAERRISPELGIYTLFGAEVCISLLHLEYCVSNLVKRFQMDRYDWR